QDILEYDEELSGEEESSNEKSESEKSEDEEPESEELEEEICASSSKTLHTHRGCPRLSAGSTNKQKGRDSLHG
ncbi:4460_t:CDS:1, partial [Racocetra persica]